MEDESDPREVWSRAIERIPDLSDRLKLVSLHAMADLADRGDLQIIADAHILLNCLARLPIDLIRKKEAKLTNSAPTTTNSNTESSWYEWCAALTSWLNALVAHCSHKIASLTFRPFRQLDLELITGYAFALILLVYFKDPPNDLGLKTTATSESIEFEGTSLNLIDKTTIPARDCLKNHEACIRVLENSKSTPIIEAALKCLPRTEDDLEKICGSKEMCVMMIGVLVELVCLTNNNNDDDNNDDDNKAITNSSLDCPTFRKARGGISFTCSRATDIQRPAKLTRSRTVNLFSHNQNHEKKLERPRPAPLFTPLKPHDNHRTITIALTMSVLAGSVNKRVLDEALQTLDEHHSSIRAGIVHYVLLLRDHRLQYRGLYTYNASAKRSSADSHLIERLTGCGPRIIKEKSVQGYFKYHLGTKQFVSMCSKGFSIQCDAVCVGDDSVLSATRSRTIA